MAKSYDELLAERVNYRLADQAAIRLLAEQRAAEDRLELPDLFMDDFIEQSDEPVQWRIDRLHAVGHNTTLTAQFKAGKSTMMINLLRSLADGASFLGQAVVKPEGRTSYWNLEVSDAQMREWCHKVGIQHPRQILVQNLRGRRTNLWDDNACADVVTYLKRNEVECWILDPGARLLPGWPGSGNPENDNGVIGELTDRLDRIKHESGCVKDLWIPLHTGRNGSKTARGAARWDDWVDSIWRLWVKEEAGVMERHFDALGRDVDFPEVVLGYDPATHRQSMQATAEMAKQISDAKTVVFALRPGPLKFEDLRKAMKGMDTTKKAAAIHDAERRDWIRKSKDGRADLYTLDESHPDVIDQFATNPPEGAETL
jgi:hypothetical protein